MDCLGRMRVGKVSWGTTGAIITASTVTHRCAIEKVSGLCEHLGEQLPLKLGGEAESKDLMGQQITRNASYSY